MKILIKLRRHEHDKNDITDKSEKKQKNYLIDSITKH